jgi:hypothetical protein
LVGIPAKQKLGVTSVGLRIIPLLIINGKILVNFVVLVIMLLWIVKESHFGILALNFVLLKSLINVFST